MKSILFAISFLTILPCDPGKISEEDINRSSVFFPLAGWIVGLMLAAVSWLLLSAGMSSLLAAICIVACEAWITRGLHLDGVADVLDGFGGGYERGRRLAIMKDSATGAFGVIGLVLTLLVKIAGIAGVLELVVRKGDSETISLLVLAMAFVPAASRWAMTFLAWRSSYPRESGTGHPFVGKISVCRLAAGFVLLLPIFLVALKSISQLSAIIILFLAILLPSIWLRFRAHRLLGGVTGDVLGASCEFSEAAGWLAASLIL
ncbi:MAG: adenosylcobinamide-GDP ribazoletransferase [Desulfobulbaceae bacterium]|nr:adenosylcobinamide-GDP ribazoletransferase [Desulfobulbaceae bacterium]